MDLSAVSGYIAGVIFAVSASLYTIDVARKKVTASVATFFMFTVINISQLASLIDKHVWHVLPFTIVGTLSSVAICLLALRNKKIYFERLDKIALIGALIGFLLWLFTKNASINLYVISAVNVITFTPLIIKSFKHPNLETTLPWRINLLASLFLMLTINSVSLVVWIVPARQFICSLLLNAGLLKGELATKKKLT